MMQVRLITSMLQTSTRFEAKQVPSEVYLYRLKIGEVTRSKKMILVQ